MSFTALGPDQIARQLYRYDRIHRAVPSPAELDDSHLRQFHELGYLAVENVFTQDEIATYRQAITDLIIQGDPRIVEFEKAGDNKNLSPEEREGYVRKCMWFVQYEPRLRAMSEHPALIGIVEKCVGSTVRLTQDMALLKPPMVGREKPWHQDLAYFNIKPPELVIGTWTAIDRATAENGCMHVIPGSHKLGPRPHYHDRDCQLSDEDVDVDQDVMVPLAPGGVLFFSGLIHHGTPPNRSAARRRAVQLHYCSTNCGTLNAQEHAEMFHDSAGAAGCAPHHYPEHQRRPITGKPGEI